MDLLDYLDISPEQPSALSVTVFSNRVTSARGSTYGDGEGVAAKGRQLTPKIRAFDNKIGRRYDLVERRA